MVGLRAFLAASLLLVLGTGAVAADHGYWPDGGVDPARVTGHRAQTSANAAPAAWGDDCSTRPASGRTGPVDVYGFVLDAHYRLVVVLAGTPGTSERVDGPNGITLFRGARAGTFVWADADGDSRFAGRHEADAVAMFFCGASALPSTDTVVAESRPTPTVWGIGLALALAATVAALASLVRRATSVRR